MCLYPVIQFMETQRPTVDESTVDRVSDIVKEQYEMDSLRGIPFNRQLEMALNALEHYTDDPNDRAIRM